MPGEEGQAVAEEMLRRRRARRLLPLGHADAEGRELFRHEGFFAKDDMLAKWKELGFEFRCPPPAN